MEIALIGNTNCGKTTVFNKITRSAEQVGNRSSVTVEAVKKTLSDGTTIVDLPGIFSLTAFSPDEKCTVGYLTSTPPNAIILVADAVSPWRSFSLLKEIMSLGIPTILLFNKSDLLKKYGAAVDAKGLEKALGIPVAFLSARERTDFGTLISMAKSALAQKPSALTPDELIRLYFTLPDTYRGTIKADKILTSRFFSIPIFFIVMSVVFFLSFSLPTLFLDNALLTSRIPDAIRNLFLYSGWNGFLADIICDGILSAVFSVLFFVPELFILYFLIGVLDGCGYLSRVRFIFDRAISPLGINGSAVVSFILGCSCSCAGIMSCRSEKSPCKRRLTIIGIPFIPCGAKLPVICLVGGYCTGSSWLIVSISYVVGIFAVILSLFFLSRLRPFRSEHDFSLTELPRYELPDFKGLISMSFRRVISFISRASAVTALCGAVLWFLSSYGLYGRVIDISDSLLRYGSEAFSVFFEPLGFGNWKCVCATLLGHIAKEQIVGFFGVAGLDGAFSGTLCALSFLFFNLLCVPCATAVITAHRELRSLKTTIFLLFYHTLFAFIFCFVFYQLGLFFTQGVFTPKTLLAFVFPVAITAFLFIKRLTSVSRGDTINQR